MKSILMAAALLLGTTALASAHQPRAYDEPGYAASQTVGAWRYQLQPRQFPHAEYPQTLTGGPSGGPNQS